MNRIFCYFSIILSFLILSSCKSTGESTSPQIFDVKAENISIIPKPLEVIWGSSSLTLPEINLICYNSEAQESSEWLSKLLTQSNLKVKSTIGNSCGSWNLVVDRSLESELGEEGYILEINKNGLFLKGTTNAGLFYAIQTLRQMLPASVESGEFRGKNIRLPHVYIKDVPAYSWRGTMVDIARSFFDLEYLKSHVDRMALYKMNRLHLHLTDDQGWRIEIKSLPELTNIGSKGSVLNGRSGFLTQEEYLDLQNYAAARNVVIIPEIDMPGHIYAALVAYPELNCDNLSNIEPRHATPPELYTGTKVGWSKLCLTKPEIYDFVSTVIGEMAEITAGPWIHLGGDEIKDDRYEEFVVKADSIVQKYGKTSIGWEEVTKAAVSSSLISQQWHGKVKSVVDNIRVIESVCTNFYFDHGNVPGQENTNNWCEKTGITIDEVYNYSGKKENVIGFEAAVWTEFVWTDDELDNRFWPRTIAVAEIAWNTDTSRNFNEFSTRLKSHEVRLVEMGINYFSIPVLENKKRNSDVFEGFVPNSFIKFNPKL